ncbi:hypothetical protein [Ruminococcus sp.]|uniref:hypothetical protein n=1 Tax=Ruminococcus sp. TaxID=41978 RepID=UPI003991994C
MQVSRNGLEDSVKYGHQHHDNAVYDMLYQLPKLVEESIFLDSTISEKTIKIKQTTQPLCTSYTLFAK